jgi:ADP-heptose:LPS heptosyltransferase
VRARQIVRGDAVDAAGKHEVERVFALGTALGLHASPGPLRVFADPETQAAVQRRLGAGPFVAVHISARQARRRWPLERYAGLLRALSETERVVLLWSPGREDDPRHPGDDAAAAQLVELTRGAGAVAFPTPDLRTAIAVLSLARRVICPDGGVVHLASALGKPVLALFAEQAQEKRWQPWQVPHRVLRPQNSADLNDLELSAVLDAYRALVRDGDGDLVR